jgi:outer membrane receptor protein involved in Fe transport
MVGLAASRADAQAAQSAYPATLPAADASLPDDPQPPKEDDHKKQIRELSLEDLLNVRIHVASTKGDDVFTAPSTVSVLDGATLRRYNIQTVGEALELLPGVEVRRTYFKRNVATFRGVLQDQYSNKVLLLINGVSTWHAATGEGAFYRIAIQDVERIEVLRGPASVMYGTNAYAGAVNIVLKRADQRRIQVDAGGHDRGGDGSVNATIPGPGGASFFLSGHAGRRIGDKWTFVDEKKVSGPVREFEEERMFTFALQSPRHTALANAFHANESFLGTTASFATGAGHTHVSDGMLFNYSYNRPISARADLTAGVVYDENTRDYPRNAADDTATNTNAFRTSGFAKSSVNIGEHLGVDVGVEHELRKSQHYPNYLRASDVVLSDNNLRNRSVTEDSIYAEATYRRANRLSLVAGSRLTKNEFFGSNVSSRLAAVFTPRERNSFKLIWGQSYRAPSLFELYFETPEKTAFGNIQLRPETSDSIEAAYVASAGGVFVQALVYHARYDDKITRVRRYPNFVSNPADTSLIYVNVGSFSANGAELELTYERPGIGTAFLNLGYVNGDHGDAEPGSNNYNFRYVPKGSASAGLARNIRHFSAIIAGNWLQATNGPLAEVGGHATLDVTGTYEHHAGGELMKHSLFAKNLFGGDSETPEFLRRNLNALPLTLGPMFGYRVQVSF